jgi:hypothetical protein
LDGFVSLEAGKAEGTVLTKPLILDGRELHVNLEALAGEVRAEILDAASQKPLPGFSLRASLAVRGDHLDAQISWGNSNLASWRARPCVFGSGYVTPDGFWVK